MRKLIFGLIAFLTMAIATPQAMGANIDETEDEPVCRIETYWSVSWSGFTPIVVYWEEMICE